MKVNAGSRTCGQAAALVVLSRLRKGVFIALAAIVMASSLYRAAIRSFQDFTLVFRSAFTPVVPAGLVTRVKIVETHVPKGSLIVYYMNKPETWEFGLWKRSLYPDYLIIPVADPALLGSKQFDILRNRYHIRYVLLANTSLSGVRDRIVLPDYPGGTPMAFGELEN